MELIFSCPKCEEWIAADKHTIQEFDFFNVNGFELEGAYFIECPYCKHRINMTFTANLVDYKITGG